MSSYHEPIEYLDLHQQNKIHLPLIKSISGIRGTIGEATGENLTPIEIIEFASAYASFIKKTHKEASIVVGRDGRITGAQIKNLVINTLIMCGLNVYDLDYSTTPTVEMSVIHLKAQGGIIISASHNPMNWNALKLINSKGEFLSAKDGKYLESAIKNNDYTFAAYSDQGAITIINNAMERHVDSILKLDILDPPLIRSQNFHVIVDPVNSTGSMAIPMLLDKLNCSYEVINGDITGHFNHDAEPQPENLKELCERVKTSNSNLGIAVDPDVDRLALVDERGTFIGEEYTVVIAADFVLSKHKGSTVSNLSSSRALRDLTHRYNCKYTPSAVGEVNVVEMMKETEAVIGGEGNGGVIYPGLHYGRDGVLGVAFALNLMAERNMKLSELRESYPNYEIVKDKIELDQNINVNELINTLREDYSDEETNTVDGLKIDFEEGWVHLRKSNTEPIIRVYAEAKSAEQARKLSNKIKKKTLALII